MGVMSVILICVDTPICSVKLLFTGDRQDDIANTKRFIFVGKGPS